MTVKSMYSGFRKCPCCKSKFYVSAPEIWVFKIKPENRDTKYFCSWKCYRAFTEKVKAKKAEKKMKKAIKEMEENT